MVKWLALVLAVGLAGCLQSGDGSTHVSSGDDAESQAIAHGSGGGAGADSNASNDAGSSGTGGSGSQNGVNASEPGAGAKDSQALANETRVGPRIVVDKWQGNLFCAGSVGTLPITACNLFGSSYTKYYPIDENVTWVQSVLDYDKAITTVGELRMSHTGPNGGTGSAPGPPRAHLGTAAADLRDSYSTPGPQGTSGSQNVSYLRIVLWADVGPVTFAYDQDFCVETWFIYGERPPFGWTIDDGPWW